MGLKAQWIAFPLHPDTPAEGRSLEELFAGRDVDIPAMLERMRSVARAEGLEFGARTRTYNSRRAQEMGKWAESNGRGEAFHQAAFRAYFAAGRNLARLEVLAEVARDAGLDPASARRAVESGDWEKAVDDDWTLSREAGVTAIPTFVFDGRRLVGAQPYEDLRRLVTGGRLERLY